MNKGYRDRDTEVARTREDDEECSGIKAAVNDAPITGENTDNDEATESEDEEEEEGMTKEEDEFFPACEEDRRDE